MVFHVEFVTSTYLFWEAINSSATNGLTHLLPKAKRHFGNQPNAFAQINVLVLPQRDCGSLCFYYSKWQQAKLDMPTTINGKNN